MLQLSFGEKESFGVWIPHCGYGNGEAKEFVGIVENLWVSWSNLPVL